MDTACLTEFLKDKNMSLEEFKKLDHNSEQYKKLTKEYEAFFEEWKEKEKEKQKQNAPQNDGKDSQKDSDKQVPVIVINEGEASREENSNTSDGSWKEAYAKEWRLWGVDNHLEYKDASLPSKGDALSFRFYESKSKDYAAEITYTSPYSVSMRGCDGKIPDSKYFEKAVSMAINNGTAIEFGNIKSPEFKAKLLAACYKQGNAQVINAPSQEEMSQWPDNLKKMVEEAKTAAQKSAQQKETKKPTKQEEKTQTNNISKIAEMKKQILNRQAKLAEAKNSGKTLSPEEQKAIEQEGMSAEEIKLRDLRGLAKAGDKKAASELYARREKTLTDEFKYEREVEGEKDGKPVYKKDKDGNFIYKQNDKGQKIETAAYKAFLENLEKNKSR